MHKRLRSLPSGFMETSAGGVVFFEDRVLLLRTVAGTWVMPKGHVEPGETPEQAAVREVHEETGVVARALGRLGHTRYWIRRPAPRRSSEKTVHWFLMEADTDPPQPRPESIFAEAVFVPAEVAQERLTYHNDRGILQKAAFIRLQGGRSG